MTTPLFRGSDIYVLYRYQTTGKLEEARNPVISVFATYDDAVRDMEIYADKKYNGHGPCQLESNIYPGIWFAVSRFIIN